MRRVRTVERGEIGRAEGGANGIFLPHVLRYNAEVPTKFMPAPGYSAYVAPERSGRPRRARRPEGGEDARGECTREVSQG